MRRTCAARWRNSEDDDERGSSPSTDCSRLRKTAAVEQPHFHGHRDRLRDRFATPAPTRCADYELLELPLFRLIPRGDTKPLAKALLTRFGTLAEVLGAPQRG